MATETQRQLSVDIEAVCESYCGSLERPPLSETELVVMALVCLESGSVAEIQCWIMQKFEYYRKAECYLPGAAHPRDNLLIDKINVSLSTPFVPVYRTYMYCDRSYREIGTKRRTVSASQGLTPPRWAITDLDEARGHLERAIRTSARRSAEPSFLRHDPPVGAALRGPLAAKPLAAEPLVAERPEPKDGRCHFLRLPAELRNLIYNMVLVYPASGVCIARGPDDIDATVTVASGDVDDEWDPNLWTRIRWSTLRRTHKGLALPGLGLSTNPYSNSVRRPTFPGTPEISLHRVRPSSMPLKFLRCPPTRIHMALLAVNKQIRNEARPIFYGANTFVCYSPSQIPGRGRGDTPGLLRHIVLINESLPTKYHIISCKGGDRASKNRADRLTANPMPSCRLDVIVSNSNFTLGGLYPHPGAWFVTATFSHGETRPISASDIVEISNSRFPKVLEEFAGFRVKAECFARL